MKWTFNPPIPTHTMKREIKFRAWFEATKLFEYYDFLYTAQIRQFAEDTWDIGKLMQYTGLKDKNGKEIYEGDVIKGKEVMGAVEYYLDGFSIYNSSRREGLADWGVMEREMIGNIYENPELLPNK